MHTPTQSAGISSFLCDLNTDVIDRLQYQVYRKCLPYYDFTSDTFFEAIEEMLFPGGQVSDISVIYLPHSQFFFVFQALQILRICRY